MAEESVRIEIGFEGGAIVTPLVTAASAEALERAVSASSEGPLQVDAEDGRYTVSVKRVVYVKLFAREAKVGFGV
jgi:hypothetical protein